MNGKQDIGDRIRTMRQKRRWTQEKLAEEARPYAPEGKKFVRESLSRIENNKSRADSWVIAALAKALETTSDYLMGWTDDPSVSGEAPFPIPTPDLYRLVEKLNQLPPFSRGKLVRALDAVMEFGDIYAAGKIAELAASLRLAENKSGRTQAQVLADWAAQPISPTVAQLLQSALEGRSNQSDFDSTPATSETADDFVTDGEATQNES